MPDVPPRPLGPPETLTLGRGGDGRAWPVLLYRAAFEGGAEAAVRRLDENGWGGAWVDGVFAYPHEHPDAHEALAVVAGRAALRLGGAAGQDVTVEAGDVVVLPVGTVHQRLDASADFRVVGAYPEGQHAFTTRRPDHDGPAPPGVAVPRPAADPVRGRGGPLTTLWR
ncbi:cupin domain-containing protein [Rubrivirga sp. S365]|uniref:Cupin domain-containing protein n=1 Tax=Rubrivirga litoralis TaxID=3075598 RepID=A0ABU3BRT0_9BACT|nr:MULTISPECIES: cupin domain-containing protein [unclassified Rubrivirga]MDT0631997.1 cupin domain-containing protein [Rubrivirga sp. F394]MDT7855310.1 cupin domain-containing protein [Rubrivirga sp. S365]